MELYTIDLLNNNRRESIIEKFESFIWTDRYSSHGDFELVGEPSAEMISRLKPGAMIGSDESDRAMIVESALRAKDSEGKTVLTVKGKSLEAILDDRVSKKTWVDPTWDLTGVPGQIVVDMVNVVCVLGTGIGLLNDKIPNLTAINLSATTPSITVEIESTSMYENSKKICDAYDLGFRITMTPGIASLVFAVYSGTNRAGVNGVAFSEDLETLSESSYLVSKEGYKNVAYVVCGDWNRIVTATGASAVSGLNRKVIIVDASDIDEAPGPDLDAAMDQRGWTALSEHQALTLFDGVANPNGMYRYNTHYFLGDIVVLRGDDGERQEMRVTEHIWSYGSDGLKSYPTLSAIGGV